MNCRFCKCNLGFNDNILCDNPECIFLKEILKKQGVKKVVHLIKLSQRIQREDQN